MICVLKHKKTDKYVLQAIGKMRQSGFNLIWNRDKSTVQFRLTPDIALARKIEDPDMDMILNYGLEAIPIKATDVKIEQDYRIIEHE